MSLVVNPSLEQQPKRRKIDTSSSSSRNCDHWFSLSHEALSCTKRINSRISWIKHKKLHLVLDLDHTLVHTIRTSKLFVSDKYLAEEAGSRNDLWRYNDGFPSETLIKLRPFVHEFLKECNEMFCMSVYTNGGPEYAQLVLELIDPEKVYFGDRVVTRRESPDFKTLDLVLADECGIVIVDDKSSVWPDHKRNLLKIVKYKFFRSNNDLEESKGFCDGEQRDESDENGSLAIVLRVLKEVHKNFFSEKLKKELDSIDVRPLLQNLLSRLKRKTEIGDL